MTATSTTAELDFARGFAVAAGERIRAIRATDLQVTTKADRSLVTAADREVNLSFIDHVRGRFSGDGVLGEEASHLRPGPRTWVIDPVDGTQQLVLGIPVFMISIALVSDGVPQVAVVHNPSTGETYWATAGGGAYRDGQRLLVSARDGRSEPAIVSGGGRRPTPGGLDSDGLQHVTIDPDLQASSARFPWPSAFSGCKVAEGTWDADLYGQTSAHDVAAVCLLVREAGGTVTDRWGRDQRYDRPVHGCVLSNGRLHDALVRHWRPA
ncbi:inositol monophosphatase family protein [Pseudonocardia sp. TRM90224]|uniref:inositol monophosphatase family protein n=1 Tax=Pseudonocardia sp. TRM90224 TaxID=2812678 RepID=UPI001E47A814|nr:inositol monophosphatase [Pseudonocardia sp. TRM90224]